MQIRIEERLDYDNPERDHRVLVVVAEEEPLWYELVRLVSTDTHPVDQVILNREERSVTIAIGQKRVLGE